MEEKPSWKQKEFLDGIFAILGEISNRAKNRDEKFIKYRELSDVQEILQLEVGEEGVPASELLDEAYKVKELSCNKGHPRFTSFPTSNFEPFSLGMTYLLEALKATPMVYEAGPVCVLIENYVIQLLNKIVGFEDGDGIFTSGGSLGNITALHLARNHHNRNIKHAGMTSSKPLVMFVSDQAHYSCFTAANVMGLGIDNVMVIISDKNGRMPPQQLESAVMKTRERDLEPFAVVSTSGTTVLGAMDPIEPIAKICQKYGMWLHVDAALGGSVLLSASHKHLMKGVQRADSVLWNGHKMLGVQPYASALIVRQKGLLKDSNNLSSALFPSLQDEDTEPIHKSLQCYRKADAAKWWCLWKAIGHSGMAGIVDKAFQNARYLTEQIRRKKSFRLILEKFDCVNVCFWFIPKRLQNKQETEDWWNDVAQVSQNVKDELYKKGTLWIGCQEMELKGWKKFLRVVITNNDTDEEYLDTFIEELEKVGQNM